MPPRLYFTSPRIKIKNTSKHPARNRNRRGNMSELFAQRVATSDNDVVTLNTAIGANSAFLQDETALDETISGYRRRGWCLTHCP